MPQAKGPSQSIPVPNSGNIFFNVWVPQLFYDLIGRIAPGCFLIAYTILFLELLGLVRFTIDWWHVGFLILSGYILSVCLGSMKRMWRIKDQDTKLKKEIEKIVDNMDAALSKSVKKKIKTLDHIYETVQLRYPKAGARMAKLRAESWLASTLTIGFIIVMIIQVLAVAVFYALNKSLPDLEKVILSFFLILFSILGAWGSRKFEKYINKRSLVGVLYLWICHKHDDIQEN